MTDITNIIEIGARRGGRDPGAAAGGKGSGRRATGEQPGGAPAAGARHGSGGGVREGRSSAGSRLARSSPRAAGADEASGLAASFARMHALTARRIADVSGADGIAAARRQIEAEAAAMTPDGEEGDLVGALVRLVMSHPHAFRRADANERPAWAADAAELALVDALLDVLRLRLAPGQLRGDYVTRAEQLARLVSRAAMETAFGPKRRR